MTDFKAMGLYRDVDRIEADLAAAGHPPDSVLTVDDLVPFDQYHYEGVAAVESAGEQLGLSSGDRVLDVGSGLGGPARVLADRFGCRVTALEIQPDLHQIGKRLTRRCRVDDRVVHVQGDVLEGAAGDGAHDALVSMLCFLHIPDRARLFERCAASLRGGGRVLIDDYATSASLTVRETSLLKEKIHCPFLPSIDGYISELADSGFEAVEVDDKTAPWRAFVDDRLAAFRSARASLVDRYGTDTVDGLDDFYSAVAELFGGDRLAGVRIRAVRAE